jgi:hypothetical protein
MSFFRRFLPVLVCVTAAPFCWGAPADPAALAAAVDAALVARDLPALVALVDTEGLSAEDIKKAGPGLAALIPAEGTAKVTTDRLPDGIDLAAPRIYQGKRMELSRAPAGIIRVATKQGRAEMVATIPYVKTSAGFFLAGRKETDLGWKGPPDRQLGFMLVEDFPKEPVKLTVRYNASGVEQKNESSHYSGVVFGQHIDEVTITGLSDGFKGRLVLREGGKEIYRSEPITGRTAFTYRRTAE